MPQRGWQVQRLMRAAVVLVADPVTDGPGRLPHADRALADLPALDPEDMPAAPRLGDVGSGHACHFPPTPATGASGDDFFNGIGAVRQGDAYEPYACGVCPVSPHPRSHSGGPGKVFINGKPAGRVGDAIGRGGLRRCFLRGVKNSTDLCWGCIDDGFEGNTAGRDCP